MALVHNSYAFLQGKEETMQFIVEEDLIWRENQIVREMGVLSTHALFIKAFEMTDHVFKKNIGHDIVAAVVSSDMEHLGVTPLSMRVTMKIKIEKVEGNHICFSFEAYDETEKIARGDIERVIVSPEYLKRKLEEKRNYIKI
jgi:predicted thioesterase